MAMGMSGDVRLALSCIEDANRYLPVLHNEENATVVDRKARELLGGPLAEAERLLKSAASYGEDIRSTYIILLGVQAGLAEECVAKWRPARRHGLGEHCWNEWAETSIEKNRQIVQLDPSPRWQLMYGMALYFADRGEEALGPLRIAENANDSKVRIHAAGLIAEIQASMGRASSGRSQRILVDQFGNPIRESSAEQGRASGTGCAVAVLGVLCAIVAAFVALSQ